MEGISVEYLDHCGTDESIANSARVSFGDFDNWNEIPEGYSKERCDKLINYLGKHEHYSPFRQNSITIRCKAPLFLARQLMKHQAGFTWNEESRRYIESTPEFFTPKEWRARPDGSLKQGSGLDIVNRKDFTYDYASQGWPEVGSAKDIYEYGVEKCLTIYEQMLEKGVAPEMARMVLPQSMLVNWVWTGNLLSLSHLYNLRIKDNAQEEAREFAKEIDKVVNPLFPVAWDALKKGEKE